MKQLTQFIDQAFTQETNNTCYEVIENEVIKSSNLNELSISGSLFSLTTFTGVIFKSCVFYASKLDNCFFIDCRFENCRFEFTHISGCNFNSTIFENCTWEFSSMKDNNFSHARICMRTSSQVQKSATNLLTNVITTGVVTDWQEAISLQEYRESQALTEEANSKSWGSTLLGLLKAA